MANYVLTITIPEAKAVAFAQGIMGHSPKPVDWQGTTEEWVLKACKNVLQTVYRHGAEVNAIAAAEYYEDVFGD
jgi:hypothetical protein